MAENAYLSYYTNQAGNGLSGFEGVRYQKGHGFFGRLISSFAKPLLGYLGKKLLHTGTNIATDVLAGQNFKTSGKKRLHETMKLIGSDAKRKMDQMGTGFLPKTIDEYKINQRMCKCEPKKKVSKKTSVKSKASKRKRRKNNTTKRRKRTNSDSFL